ncbi:hypothetical protein D3C72_1736790 [compost metagenome]
MRQPSRIDPNTRRCRDRARRTSPSSAAAIPGSKRPTTLRAKASMSRSSTPAASATARRGATAASSAPASAPGPTKPRKRLATNGRKRCSIWPRTPSGTCSISPANTTSISSSCRASSRSATRKAWRKTIATMSRRWRPASAIRISPSWSGRRQQAGLDHPAITSASATPAPGISTR